MNIENLSPAEKIFLTLFRDLKLEVDTNAKQKEGQNKTYYRIKLKDNYISTQDVIQMVKDYQDAVWNHLMGK